MSIFNITPYHLSAVPTHELTKHLPLDPPRHHNNKLTPPLVPILSAGLRPIATCSPANFPLAQHFGAEKVFDYHHPTCATDIRTYTSNQLAHALDCVSLADTTQLCYSAIGRAGGRYVSLEPYRTSVTDTRPTIEPSWLMVLSVFGKDVALEGEYGRKGKPEDRRLGKEAFEVVEELLGKGEIETHPAKVMEGGWKGVVRGVDVVRGQGLSGEKLVYAVP